MNELKIFRNEKFGEVRTMKQNDNIWFCIKDICDILSLTNPRMVVQRLDDDEVRKFNLGGQVGETNFTNESGLYTLLLRSDKQEAKPFRKWVTSEVIPSIRKTGIYMTDNVWESLMNNPEEFGKMIIEYGRIRNENENLKLTNRVQEQQIAELQPKATYYDLILQNPNLLTTRLIASDYGMTPNKFNEMLHKYGVQYKQSGIWFLYREYSKFGYTQTKTHTVVRSNGQQDTVPHMYWTQKGRIFLYDFLKKKGIIPIIEQTRKGA